MREHKMNEGQMPVDAAIFLPSLRGGGAERIAVTVANGMAGRGIRVDLVLSRAEGPYLRDVGPGVRVVDLGARRVLSSLPALVRYLRREKPPAMLSLLNYANVIAVIARMLSRVKTRLLVSERSLVSRGELADGSISEKLVLPLMRWTYPRADGVIAISKGVADHLVETIMLPRNRITVIYNPATTPELLIKASAALEHPWLGQGKPPVILGVGRLTSVKDFSSLIRAFAKVRTKRDCRLVILGEGELRSELEALVRELGLQDSVQLLGFVENPHAWMARVELFVFSSIREGFGNVLVEAMACGTQVVSTDCPGGPSEILEGGKWGALVPVGNVEAIADSMLDALESPVSLNVKTRAKDFDSAAIVGRYIEMLCPSKVDQ